MNPSLNRIYYGPPGTGKTYNVAIEALEIVNSAHPPLELGTLEDKDKFDRILRLVREKYQTEDFKAKSNSIYRNDRAIMWMLGYLQQAAQANSDKLTKTQAIEWGMDQSPSTWAQLSQYITQFRLVDNWRETSTILLNDLGKKLRDNVSEKYNIERLKGWREDCPDVVKSFYHNIFETQKLEEFTPVLKMFFGALCMALHGELYKQNNEQRKATEQERLLATRFFDTRADVTDLKWIGHLARTLQGLGLVDSDGTEVESRIIFKLTIAGRALVKNIIRNWESNYPTLFRSILSFDDSIMLGYIQFITFHQSYSYEEFIEGLKPVLLESGDLGYEMVDGIFKLLCNRAAVEREHNFVIIIDEINRGNLSKIFGELITLIEPSKRL